MKKSKLVFLLLLLIVNLNLLTASEVTSKSQIKQVNFELNDNAKLLIDCSIKKNKLFGFTTGTFYDENEYINEFKETICLKKSDSKTHEINFKDLSSALLKIRKNHNYNIYIDFGIRTRGFTEFFEREIILDLEFSNSSPFSNKRGQISLNVISLINNEFSVSTSFYYSEKDNYIDTKIKKDDYLIKSYKYDYINKKILDFQLDKPLEYLQNKLITFTNTYDIDDMRECIEGEVWIKKYGAKADIRCEYIKKEEIQNEKK